MVLSISAKVISICDLFEFKSNLFHAIVFYLSGRGGSDISESGKVTNVGVAVELVSLSLPVPAVS